MKDTLKLALVLTLIACSAGLVLSLVEAVTREGREVTIPAACAGIDN